MWRCRLYIHRQWTEAPGLRRGLFKGSREWEIDQLAPNCPTPASNPLGPRNRRWQTPWPRLNPAFEWDNKTGFVHPFEMGPNYVWLINETLCPNRRDTVEKWSESTLCRKRLMKFSEGIHLPGAGLRQKFSASSSFPCFPIRPPPFFSPEICLTLLLEIYFASLVMISMFILSFRKKCTVRNILDLFVNVNRKISQKVDNGN